MSKNYTVYHLHSTASNLSGAGMDSVTNYKDYIKIAKEYGMTSLCFSEHGNFFLYKKKKDEVEKNGMKYIHGIEAYVTENLQEQVRDNYHMILIAKNYEGFKELNSLQSKAFERDGHYYYAPRILFDDILNTSENIIITSACIGGIFGKGNESLKEKFLQFMSEHKDRCFLEIQHHNVEKQKEYNLRMLEYHNKYGIPLIAGTDTHCLNSDHEKARKIMQLSKKTTFNDDEANLDLIFRSYDELVEAYKIQGILPEYVFLEAIENTNVMADMVEPITFDLSFKYPKLYENSKDKLHKMIFNEESITAIVNEGFSKEEVINRLKEEYDTFVAVDAVDYILLIKYIIDWAHGNDMWQGPARGSAASSLALYELGITEVNPLKYGFKFWRFMHKDKYSAADVDTDWAEKDRDRLKEWMLLEKMNLPKIQTAEIITFNTIALKGAIRDVGRGLNMPLEEVDVIAKAVKEVTEDENKYVTIDDSWRKKYPELFRYVDLVQGVFTSVGSHPSGVLVTDEEISEEIGYCYIKGDDYPVSVLDMVELDSRNFVKEDLLGLDNVGIINETCKLANIDRVSPKTINFEDDLVWSKIKEDTSLLFQINSDYGKRTVNKMFEKNVWEKIKKNIPNITRFDLLAFICALVRPCGKNVYPIVTEGNSRKTGIKEIDDLLGPEMGYPILQETQMEFVQKFCGFSFLESDKLRKCVAEGTLVTMADGSLKPIEDVEVGDRVISYKNGRFIPKTVIGHYDNGVRKTVKVLLAHGMEIECTPDHKILTPEGWKQAKDLKYTELVYSPRKISAVSKNENYLSNNQCWLIGALIGDGTLGKKWTLSLTNSDKNIIDKTISVYKEFDPDRDVILESVRGKTVEKIYCALLAKSTNSNLRRFLNENSLSVLSAQKHIPDLFFNSNPEQTYNFLAGLFDTDGVYVKERGIVQYATTSKRLAFDIKSLLSKIGVLSKISVKKVSGYNYNSHVVYIDLKKDVKTFVEKIVPYMVGYKKSIFTTYSKTNNGVSEKFPSKCKAEILECLNKIQKSANEFEKEYHITHCRLTNTMNITRKKVEEFAEHMRLPYCEFLLNSDVHFVPVKSVVESGKKRVFDLEIEDTHNYLVSGIIGHNCIAKKRQTREQLPLIKEGFEKNAKVKYNLTQEQSDEIINPFLQCILDATRYAFGRAHDYSYTAISYESAWLRTYYPLEYLTCCFNSYVDKQDKINEVTEYCVRNKIKIQNPKFRYSKSDYFFDNEQKTIYKGTKSIKFLNGEVSDALYNLRNNQYEDFVDALKDIFETGINSRQLNILIKLDYFSEFGNSKELLRIVDMCTMFKNGEAKSVSKTKLENDNILYRIVARNSNETPKKFTINNCWNIIKECEFYIKSVGIKDFTYKEKADFQNEYMGYVDLKTNDEKDRPNIFVLSKKELKSKTSKEPWAVQIEGQSIGSGIRNSYTIFYKEYKKEPFDKMDIIRIKRFHKNNRGYWNVDSYERMLGI